MWWQWPTGKGFHPSDWPGLDVICAPETQTEPIYMYVINYSDPVTSRRLWQKYRVDNVTVQDETKRESYKTVCYNASCPFPKKKIWEQ